MWLYKFYVVYMILQIFLVKLSHKLKDKMSKIDFKKINRIKRKMENNAPLRRK